TRLVEMIEDGEVKVEAEDPDTGARAVRPLDYGDIAILCRASTSFPAYENALERAGIPFLTVAGGGFYDRPEVRELLNALRALAMPSDDLALAGLLRSPACGLSDVALYRLVKARAEGATLWQTLQSVALHDLEDEATRAAAARDLIAHLHVQAGRVPVADLLKQLLDAAGYRAALLRAGQARAARNAAKLLADAHRAGMVNIGAFLDYVGQVRDAGTREGEARTLETGAVQLMTVHAAKGLEFPVVVIGEAQRGEAGGPRAGQGHLLDPGLGPVLALKNEAGAASAIHRLASQVEQDQEAAESARLYYVAATRARELLILNGVGNARANGTLSLSGWLGQSAATLNVNDHVSCDRQGEAAHRITLEIDGHPVSVEILEPGATPPERIARAEMKPEDALPETLPLLRSCLPAEPETAVPMGDAGAPDAERIARDPPRRVWRVVPGAGEGAPAWVVGALVHEALAHWRFPGDASLDFDAWLGARARTYGLVDDRRIANAAQRAIRLLRRFQTSALFAKMDAAPVRRHEAPYSLRDDDGRVENGIFDALFCTSGGDWTLVDFKIDRVRDTAALDTLLAESDYVAQMARYLRAAGYLLGQRPTPVLCFLDVGGTVQLITDRWT
ncbi:MAG: hypothetical protein JXB35_08595, partial [Anaerolineae bacterium]|nr:hypothetical protein [Anaerolineae bacterium]